MNRPSAPPDSLKCGKARCPDGDATLTDGQMWLWAGQRLHPELPTYNMAFAFAIDGPVDATHLQKAVQTLIDGSDALRTIIDDADGAPRARVLPSLPYSMEYFDWSTGEAVPSAADPWAHDRAAVALRIDQRMFDTTLVKLAPDRFVWYLNIHHLISDGWSYALVYQHVLDNYERSVRGELREVPASLSFWEWVARERAAQRPSGQVVDGESELEKALPRSDPLHFYGRSPIERSMKERRHTCALGIDRTQKLRTIAGTEEFRSLNEVLSILHIFLALVFAYLHRVTGAHRMVIGVPFHQRSTAEARAVIGLLQDTLPVVAEVADGDTYTDLIRKTTQATWEAQRNRRHGHSSAKQRPAFDVMVNFPNVSFPAFHEYPTRATWVHSGFGDGHRLLFLQILDFTRSGNLALQFDFNEGIMDERHQERAVTHFLMLLDDFLADPSRSIQQVELLQPAEYQDNMFVEATSRMSNARIEPRSPLSAEGSPAEADSAYSVSRSEIEREVAEIWRQVLHLDRVGRDEKFFEIGGHSLHLVQVHSKLRERFGGALLITDMFRLPTVSAMAEYLSEKQMEAAHGQKKTFGPQEKDANQASKIGKPS